MNLSQDLAVWGYNLEKTTWISKKIKDEVEESGISVNEVTKKRLPTIRMIRFVLHCAKILIGPTFFVGV